MLKIPDSHLVKSLEKELHDVWSFEANAEKLMKEMSSSSDEQQLVSMARALAFNKRHIERHLARAEAMLQLAGFEIEDGELTPSMLEFRVITYGDIAED